MPGMEDGHGTIPNDQTIVLILDFDGTTRLADRQLTADN
jgi:hypothetical protein